MKTIFLIIILIIAVLGSYFLFNGLKSAEESKVNSNTFDIQGMKVEILKQGEGEEAKSGDKVSVHYVGTLEDGTKFDSSVDRGTPFTFTLGIGQVIQGWDMGVAGMKIGEKRKLTIPSDLAYGSTRMGSIPPNSTLIFEVELLGINQ
ncbi:MAG: FKBP-type peptidyl-prolyl cis-trans isomerase [Candidatus Parcubacteria bacterium]|nr:FKBP-type peptidyl-prolyl cis-trans isomerase [Candidatus Parcubacteria bacterium]